MAVAFAIFHDMLAVFLILKIRSVRSDLLPVDNQLVPYFQPQIAYFTGCLHVLQILIPSGFSLAIKNYPINLSLDGTIFVWLWRIYKLNLQASMLGLVVF